MKKGFCILLMMAMLLTACALAEAGKSVCNDHTRVGSWVIEHNAEVTPDMPGYEAVHIHDRDLHVYRAWCDEHQSSVWQFRECPRNEQGGCALKGGKPADPKLCQQHEYELGTLYNGMTSDSGPREKHGEQQKFFSVCWQCGDMMLVSVCQGQHTWYMDDELTNISYKSKDAETHYHCGVGHVACIFCPAEGNLNLITDEFPHQWTTDEQGCAVCQDCGYIKKE